MYSFPPSLAARSCISCPSTVPQCACATTQQCIIISTSCSSCATAQCVDNNSSSTSSQSSSGVSKGALAGAIVGVLAFFALSISLFLWHRRRSRQRQGSAPAKKDVPASAAAVLSRPDPIEKHLSSLPTSASSHPSSPIRVFSSSSPSDINLDPNAPRAYAPSQSRGSVQSNPFTDTHSIQTASDSTQSTNVIPIALVPHPSVSSPPHSPSVESHPSSLGAPARPARSPDLNIRMDPIAAFNLDHVNISNDSFRPPNAPYALSQASGFTNNSSRESYMTTGSFASDVLTEAPQIVTPGSGAVRQVLGVARAEVIRAPGSQPPTPRTPEALRAARVSKPPVRSPLAQNSFEPAPEYSESDTESVAQEIPVPPNPFGDEHTPLTRNSPSPSVTTFGTPSPRITDTEPSHASSGSTDWVTRTWQSTASNRPESDPTHLEPPSALMPPPLRTGESMEVNAGEVTTTASPKAEGREWSLAEQQQQALAYARARADASGLGPGARHSASSGSASVNAGPAFGRRTSGSSVASAGGDSLLESFTFVPPSPISSRPPRSPLAQTVYTHTPSSPHTPRTPQSQMQSQQMSPRGISTASGASALEGYTFRIDSGSAASVSSGSNVGAARGSFNAARGPPPTAMPASMRDSGTTSESGSRNLQRASLDTLALTQDLSAFPLNFDQGGRDSFGPAR